MVRVFGRRVPGSGSEGRVCSGRVEAEQSASLLFLYISLFLLPPSLSLPSFFLFLPQFTFINSPCATLLRVPSFPREPLRCLLILPWIPTGGPDSSKVSMLKSWLWAIAVSPSLFSLSGYHS